MTTLEPPVRAALGASVTTVLRDAILDGSLPPGHKLHETALATQLAVSRSPVREALMQLERERLVDSPPNRPATVHRATATEIRQIYTIRAALEGIAARWAAERTTTALARRLGSQADALDAATRAAGEPPDPNLVALSLAFHETIADAAGSEELSQLLRSLRNQIRLVMIAGLARMPAGRAQAIHAEHVALVTAIAKGDGARAELLASRHVRGARDRLIGLADADG
jgi:DNA-binding GntR family transcriptional regulator